MKYEELIKLPIFNRAEDSGLKELLKNSKIINLSKNEVLFRQGEKSDKMYLLLSGGLISILEYPDATEELQGTINIGELVGEMGVFSYQKKRSLTVKALDNSSLLEIKNNFFDNLIKIAPNLTKDLLQQVVNRGRKLITKKLKKNHRLVLIFPANEHLDLSEFRKNLTPLINGDKQKILHSDTLKKIYRKKTIIQCLNYVENLYLRHKLLVYFASYKSKEDAEISNLMLKQADSIFIAADGKQQVNYSDYIKENILQKKKVFNLRRNEIKIGVLLLWPDKYKIFKTKDWIKKSSLVIYYHVIDNCIESYQRLVRFFSGKAVCLVLSGGATRCWAHIGMISALKDKNIPIDAICGTSSGAGIAATYLVSKDIDQLIHYTKMISDVMKKASSIPSLVVMPMSIYNSKIITKCFKSIFGNKIIQNSSIPFFAISCNINTVEEVVENEGLVWQAILASGSLPSLFPPVEKNGDLYIDGGAVNVLPVDQAKNMFGDSVKIIASDLDTFNPDKTRYRFSAELSISDLLKSRLGLKDKNVMPTVFTILFRTMLSGSIIKYRKNVKLADYYINHDVRDYEFLNFTAKYRDSLINLGYANTIKMIKKYNLCD